jgi:hypothetical protein
MFRNPFAGLFAGGGGPEDRIAAYVIREHQRGRDLAQILEDRYILNRCSRDQIGRLLERPEVVHALGESTVDQARETFETR